MSEPIALAYEEREYTLSQLDALASGWQPRSNTAACGHADRVALMSSNRPEFVVALWAIWRLGASAVLLSPAWKRTEVEQRAGADRAVARRGRPSGARRIDADAVTGRTDHPGAADV